MIDGVVCSPRPRGHVAVDGDSGAVVPLLTGALGRGRAVIEWPYTAGVRPRLALPCASSCMIRWSRVLLSHTLDAARSY